MIARLSRSFVLIAVLAVLAFALLLPRMAGPADAADVAVRPLSARAFALPFPRSERTQSVWASGACWRECGAYCAWGEAGCLQRDTQGTCLKLTDTCDRYCQRECRTAGGPLLPLDF